MGSGKIGLGNKLTISTESGYCSQHPYWSQVGDVLADDLLLISAPASKGHVVKLPMSNDYIFIFYTPNGLYKANGKILEYCTQNEVSLLKVKLDKLEHIQRRLFYRAEITMDFTFTRHDDLEKYDSEREMPIYKGLIKNLSGNGICFSTKVPLRNEERVYFNLFFENTFMNIEGIVLSTQRCDNKEDIHIVRLMFVDIESKKQEKIVQYIFQKERVKIRKKQLDEDG